MNIKNYFYNKLQFDNQFVNRYKKMINNKENY